MSTSERAAIVGIGCRFPGARDATEFWHNLSNGVESIASLPAEALRAAGVPDALAADPDYVPAQGVLDANAEFDAEFFAINPREADIMDPQHRLLLECAWETLEDAGWIPERAAGRVGVFVGAYRNDYADLFPAAGPAELFARNVATENDYLATRISYKLNLRGPSVTVQTACSTSLVAVHLAAQAVLGGECDVALAGGVTVRAGQPHGYVYQRGGILSADGHCRAFDADAGGSVIGEGIGLVAVKRLSDALAAGDDIRAVILGSAVGNDGGDRVGFTAPSVDGQACVVRSALTRAGVHPETIGYLETHGSGTPLGDRIEIDALNRAFRDTGWVSGTCVIGSVKTNIGHTHTAAGIAGLIKAVLALRHRAIPPSLHYTRANPRIEFAASPFRVSTALTGWPGTGHPRRAGVSSFGMGGTGAHVVLEEAPDRQTTATSRPHHVLTISGRSEAALESATDRLANHLDRHPGLDVGDVAATLQRGRRHDRHRRVVVAGATAEAAAALGSRDPARTFAAECARQDRPVVFMFPGLGDQFMQMGRGLYESEPCYRRELDRCADVLVERCGFDLRAVLYPGDPPAPGRGVDLRRMLNRDGSGQAGLAETAAAQPALFAVEYALARLWLSRGVVPDALIGYSLGEYVAACLAGVVSLSDALYLVAERAKLIGGLPGGAMLAVPLSEPEVTGLLGPELSLAAVNGPALCVVAGPPPAVDALRDRLTSAGVAARPLNTAHAFHSRMMAPIGEAVTKLAAAVRLHEPTIPYLSNVTGDWIDGADATDPGYWARHLCAPVRFTQGVAALSATPDRVFLEVGPGQSLGSLVLSGRPRQDSDALVLASLPASFDGRAETEVLAGAAGKLWLAGVSVDWAATHAGEQRATVPLPTYPFQRRTHGPPGGTTPAPKRTSAGRRDFDDWFSVPAWEPLAPLPPGPSGPPARWLVLADDCGIGAGLARRLADDGQQVTVVEAGTGFAERDTGHYVIDPGDPEHYPALLHRLSGDGLPTRIVHCWTVTDRDTRLSTEDVKRVGFLSLIALARALGGASAPDPVEVSVVSSDMHPLGDTVTSRPEKALLLGPCRVWPQEVPTVTCRSIDIGDPVQSGWRVRRTHDALFAELTSPVIEKVVALRGAQRWRQTYHPAALGGGFGDVLRDGGTYLITGGLGELAMVLAEHLARSVRANLVLVGRSPLPPRDRWSAGAAEFGEVTARRIRQVLELEALGAEVVVHAADVADPPRLRAVVEAAAARFGSVHGVVHAAGVPGGGLIQLKDAGTAAGVLAPKVDGALAILDACSGIDLDFLVFCSSTLAITGGAGQVDYCAANAFLDALAHHNDACGGPRTISINWDAWREVGMAARTVGGAAGPDKVAHPLLGTRLVNSSRGAVYGVRFAAADSWLVDEHRMLGHPVVPGTGHLEMVRAAFADRTGSPLVELREVTFATPIVLAQEHPKDVRVVLEAAGDGFTFAVASDYGDGSTWQWHSTGLVGPATTGPRCAHDLAVIIGRLRDAGRMTDTGPMGFGPRSRCLERMWVGDNEFLAELVLPDEFVGDLAALALHPSIMDIAAAFVGLSVGKEVRIPISYGRLAMFAPLPQRVFTYHRYPRADTEGRETVSGEFVLMDAAGVELVVVEDFVLKRVADLQTRLSTARDGSSDDIARYRIPDLADPAPAASGAGGLLRRQWEVGIRSAEGVDAFRRILAAAQVPQIVVSTRDLDTLVAEAGAAGDTEQVLPHDRDTRAHPRPNLLTAYAEPRNETERRLTVVWQDLLGVDRIGVHDHFFELGGHSLLGIQLAARLRDDLGLDLPLGTLFEALTIAEMAVVVDARKAVQQVGDGSA